MGDKTNKSGKPNAVYAPGELDKVREKLGYMNESEAKRMAQVLGGEVGVERRAESEVKRSVKPSVRRENVEVSLGGKRGRRIDLAGSEQEELDKKNKNKKDEGPFPGDDPAVPLKLGYFERIKMDQYAGQMVFEIKSSFQVLTSIFSFFKEPVDYVSSGFVTKRMNEYYKKIEKLVTASRNLFPKSNLKRDRQLKRASPFVYKVFDAIRSWNIEQIAVNISELQSHPRSVTVFHFADTLRLIFKQLFILDDLSIDNLKTAFKLVYKVLYIESPMEAKDKYQDIIRNIIASFMEIRRSVQFGLYPLLMKLISDRYITYERFFIERRRRYIAFLNMSEAEQLKSENLDSQQIENVNVEALQEEVNEEQDEPALEGETADEADPDSTDPKETAKKEKENAEKAENKALEQGLAVLEVLFPKAGWETLESFPDIYPYFSDIYNIRRGYELISPADSLQQICVLMHIMEDIFYGMRYVKFGVIVGPDGNHKSISEELGDIINNWRSYMEDGLIKEYLPRLTEYCRLLENSEESRASAYAKKIVNEMHWVKRLYFLPYYKFESLGPPPFQKNDVIPIYNQVRKLRKYFTSVAAGIEQGMRAGGAAAKAPCNGIINPWDVYKFEVPNAVSKRLDMMLSSEKRNNATLVYFSLSATAVLDYILNNENSWSYSMGGRPGPLFRSVKNEGITPMFGLDEKIDTDQIFRESLKKG